MCATDEQSASATTASVLPAAAAASVAVLSSSSALPALVASIRIYIKEYDKFYPQAN